VSPAEASVGVSDRPGRAGTAIGLLITQRSRVQIPPPLPSSQVKGLFRSWKGPSAYAVCTELCEASEEGRRGGWAVRRTPGTSFATQAVDGLSLRRGIRASAIDCR
jgi:hypothetical protein